ncbi:MAG: hypothetical protein COU90_01600 [Candidatus Ryanbacteria bacterium CG10_big_fil_rev_8_21_14_0_10_43_42]|uniref:Uncharacterized protein n=1 Tax=Candidatus Ryanbacteria bacterium CG10_big_fil_rev_8_21_14_0_10_43_42 TaxID=1974864 RepID=A0A2M8KX64_9BACT|nr:MAG: hypothetical protein COU90_01600 [Candidatus Ryanbacteria bacterium CG10_big_fil_rev_8_21_14_0_10_43_42]
MNRAEEKELFEYAVVRFIKKASPVDMRILSCMIKEVSLKHNHECIIWAWQEKCGKLNIKNDYGVTEKVRDEQRRYYSCPQECCIAFLRFIR